MDMRVISLIYLKSVLGMSSKKIDIIKIGGSVITDKSKYCSLREDQLSRISKEISQWDRKCIIIHGAGSFGHILAKEYYLNEGFKNNEQLKGFSLTHAMIQKLNLLVLNSLHEKSIAAVSIPPHIILKLDNHKPKKLNYNFCFFNDLL